MFHQIQILYHTRILLKKTTIYFCSTCVFYQDRICLSLGPQACLQEPVFLQKPLRNFLCC